MNLSVKTENGKHHLYKDGHNLLFIFEPDPAHAFSQSLNSPVCGQWAPYLGVYYNPFGKRFKVEAVDFPDEIVYREFKITLVENPSIPSDTHLWEGERDLWGYAAGLDHAKAQIDHALDVLPENPEAPWPGYRS